MINKHKELSKEEIIRKIADEREWIRDAILLKNKKFETKICFDLINSLKIE